MEKYKKRWEGMSYRSRLLFWFVLIGLVPLLIVGILFWTQTIPALREREQSAMQASLKTAVSVLDAQTLLYEDLLTYLTSTSIIIEIPYVNEEESIYERYAMLTYEYDTFLNSLYTLHPEIEQITVYVPYDDLTHGEQLRPLSDLETQSWYSEDAISAKPQWHLMDDGTIMVTQLIPNPYSQYVKSYSESCVSIRLDAASFFSSLESVSTDFHLLVSSDGVNLYDFYSESLQGLDEDTHHFSSMSALLENNAWTIRIERPDSVLYAPVRQIIALIFSVFLCTFLVIVFTSRHMAQVFVQRIDLLGEKMQQVQEGHLDVSIHDDRPDEIGRLTNSFQEMLDRINDLIRINYQKELEIREANLLALQAQINPHFLYNCLSLIHNRAVVIGQPEISRMALLLSSFYRNMLNKGRADTLLEKELQTVKSYVEIQQLLHDDCFSAVYQIDPSLGDLCVPNLLLQPLAENAILHGLLPKENGERILAISVAQAGNQVLFTIMDNGVGIDPEKCKTLTSVKTSGYGLKNVHERLILTYGPESGLHIESIPGEGTLITFSIPLP